MKQIKIKFTNFASFGEYWFKFISKSQPNKSPHATSFKVKESRKEIERIARENRCVGYSYKND